MVPGMRLYAVSLGTSWRRWRERTRATGQEQSLKQTPPHARHFPSRPSLVESLVCLCSQGLSLASGPLVSRLFGVLVPRPLLA